MANGDVGDPNADRQSPPVYAVAVADPFGASAVEIVTITLNGIDGNNLIPIWSASGERHLRAALQTKRRTPRVIETDTARARWG